MPGKCLTSVLLTTCLFVTGLLFSGCLGQNKGFEEELVRRDQAILELQTQNDDLQAQLAEKDEVLAVEMAALQASRDALVVALQGTGAGVTTQGTDLIVSLPSVLLFGSGKYELKKSAKKHLSRIAKVVRANFPNAMIRVEGYTDNQPIKKLKEKFKSNWELSAARAASVVRYLVKKGHINPENIYLAGFGQYHPVASNKTAGGRKKNRRVGIVVLTGGS